MTESGHRPRRRAWGAIIALLVAVLAALLPAAPAHAANGLTLTSLNDGETVVAGSTVQISWTSSGVTTLDIQLYKNATLDSTIKSSVSAASKKVSWAVPVDLAAGIDYQVRLVETAGGGAVGSDLSEDNFSVVAPTVEVKAPVVTDVWNTGTTKVVRWDGITAGDVQIDLYSGGLKVGDITPGVTKVRASAKQYSWVIPQNAVTASGTYNVRVFSAAAPTIFDDSANFQLNIPTFTVSAPALNDNWGAGSTQVVKWNLPGISGNVQVQLTSTADAVLKTFTPAAGIAAKLNSLKVTIPHDQALGTYRIRVVGVTATSMADSSDDFNVTLTSATITAPAAAETWYAGSTKTIKWDTKLTGNVKLELVDLGGTPVGQPIKPSISAAAKTTSWAIPLTAVSASGSYRIRLSSTASGNAATAQSGIFTLGVPSLNAGSPSAATIGVPTTLSWTQQNFSTGNVKVEVLPFGGGTATTVKASQSAKVTTVNWTPPGTLASGNYVLRLTAIGAPGIVSTSNSFAISDPTISVSSMGGPHLAGSTTSIAWTTTPNLSGNVKITVTGPGGTSTVKATHAAKSSPVSWAIPLNIATASGSYTVTVQSLVKPSISGVSAAFTIDLPTITVSTLGSAATWNVASSQAIAWTTTMPSGNVKVELVKTGGSGGVASYVVKSSIAASSLGTTFTVPSSLNGGQYQIKVSAIINGASINDTSTASAAVSP